MEVMEDDDRESVNDKSEERLVAFIFVSPARSGDTMDSSLPSSASAEISC